MEEKFFDCIVLGGGPAGMSAAIYASRGNLQTAIIDLTGFGGQPVNYLEIENYPGFQSIEGWNLAEKLEEHLNKFNAKKFPNEEIQSVELREDIKTIATKNGIFRAKAVILATGASPCKLGIKGEKEFFGKGVSYCAVCDGAFYRDKTVVVIGGGNAAVEEGCYLTRFAKKVYIMHRRDKLRADKIVQTRAFNNPKTEFIYDSVPVEIKGENNRVNSVLYKNTKTNEQNIIEADGVFPYIGFCPNTELFNGQIVQDEYGFIMTDENMRTSETGVFAAGDVRKTPLRQVVTAVSDGAIAGHGAVKYLEEIESAQEEEAVNLK